MKSCPGLIVGRVKRGDHLWKPLGFLILAVYWFQPLCWLAYILLCKDIELACDERVIRKKDASWRANYCQVLFDCSVENRKIIAVPLAFGEVGVKERVKRVFSYKRTKLGVVIVAIIIVANGSMLIMGIDEMKNHTKKVI